MHDVSTPSLCLATPQARLSVRLFIDRFTWIHGFRSTFPLTINSWWRHTASCFSRDAYLTRPPKDTEHQQALACRQSLLCHNLLLILLCAFVRGKCLEHPFSNASSVVSRKNTTCLQLLPFPCPARTSVRAAWGSMCTAPNDINGAKENKKKATPFGLIITKH